MFGKRLTLLLGTLIITLVVVELFLAHFFPQKTYSSLYKNAISCFAKSDTTVFTLKPNCAIPFTDFDTNEAIKTQTNNLGYRGSDFPLDKPPGEKRILLEGDSFILGFGVKDEDVISSQLENQLEKINKTYSLAGAKVINSGYSGGFGPDGYFLHLKNAGAKLDPDLVVFSIFVYNDLSDIENDEWIGTGEFGQPEKVISRTTTVDGNGYLVPLSTPLVYRLPIIRESNLAVLLYNTYLRAGQLSQKIYDRIRFAIKAPVMPTGEGRDSNLPGAYTSFCVFGGICHRRVLHLFTDLMSTILASNKLVNSSYKDGKPHFVVMLIPVDFQLYPEALDKYQRSGIPYEITGQTDPHPQKRIKEMLEKEKIPYIDLLPAFRSEKERLYFIDDGHWNALGHKAAAREVLKWIEESYK